MPEIRKMTEADLDQVTEIAAAVFARPWSRQGFADALPMDNTCFLVALEREIVLGYCGIYMAVDEGEIINVAVRPEAQNQGVADKLLKALLAEGRAYGVGNFFLEVRASNTYAIRLYEKNGFVRQGIRRRFYTAPLEDAYVMNRREPC